MPLTARSPAVAVTRGIRVEASARLAPAAEARSYLPANAASSVALYTFRVRITNQGTVPARLLERHIVIVDGDGTRSDIEGEGVIGQKPHLRPGETFVHDSCCDLATIWGTLEGSYTFQDDAGERIVVAIPRLLLTPPPDPSSTAV